VSKPIVDFTAASNGGRCLELNVLSLKAQEPMQLLEGTNHGEAPEMVEVTTPLQARALVHPTSFEYEACDMWEHLHRGRGGLCRSDPDQWFEASEFLKLPPGLIAELYASSNRWQKFQEILDGNPEARHHILQLPKCVTDATSEEWKTIHKAVEMARTGLSGEGFQQVGSQRVPQLSRLNF